MVQIFPFSGWRYDLSQVGALSEVTAPPLDCVDANMQRDLYRQHPCNVIRLAMNREEPGDASRADRITRAEDFLRIWKREGILLKEHDSAFYVIQSDFEASGIRRSRWSLVARMRLPETLPALVVSDSNSIAEKTELLTSLQAEVIPVTVLAGTDTELDEDLAELLERSVRLKTPVEFIDDRGQHHRMWPVIDKSMQVQLEQSVLGMTGLVVDGFAELTAATQYRDSLKEKGRLTDPNHPAHAVLAWILPADDSACTLQPIVFPINAVEAFSVRDFTKVAASDLVVQYVGNETTASEDATELASLNAHQPCVAVGSSDGHWCIVAATDPQTNEATLRSRIAEAVSTSTGSVATIGAFLRTGRTAETLPTFVGRIFRQPACQAMVIQPSKLASDVILQHLMSGADKPIVGFLPELAVTAPLPIGFVFSSLEVSL